MKHLYKFTYSFAVLVACCVLPSACLFAGNPDRVGQAGATELLINPWARSSGWSNANSGSVRGLEAIFGNVAGTAFTKKTDVIFSHTKWLKGSDININAFGLTQKMGESSVLGLAIMSMDFGDIPVTTTDNPGDPESSLGTFSPRYMNINFSYAKIFSHSIYGGINVKIIDESISNTSASGFAVDAGIQYVTGTNEDKDNIKFGISLKNVGTPMKFGGDGLSTRVTTAGGYELTIEQRTADFEIPSLVNIGFTYDFHLTKDHRISLAGTFNSNSFTHDQYSAGLEYGFRNLFMLRGGFTYEENIFNDNPVDNTTIRTTAFTGPAAGFTVELPLGKTGKSFGLDYSYRATKPFDGTHSFGLRFSL